MGVEVKNLVSETERARQPERLRVSEIQRLPGLGLTVLVHHGKNGEQKALVVRDHARPENYREIDTVFQRVRNSRGLKTAISIVSALGAAAGCAADYSGARTSGNGIGQKSSAMNMGDMSNLGTPQMAAWTQFGDESPNIEIIGGKKIILINRNNSIWYAECEDLQDCLISSTPSEVNNLPTGFGNFAAGGIYEQVDGTKQFLFKANGSPTLGKVSIVSYDADGLTLGNDVGELVPVVNTAQFTLTHNWPTPYLIHQAKGGEDSIHAKVRNLSDDEETSIPLQQIFMNQCGTPDFSSGAAVASFLESEWGTEPVICKLITAPTLDELADELLTTESFVASQNDYRSTPRLTNPRLIGKYLIYARYDRNPDTGQMEPRIWYAVVQDYCGDAVCNGTEDTTTCEGDCPATGPVCGDGACETPDETRALCPTDCPPECGDASCEAAGGETPESCPTDCPPPDPCGDGTCDPAAGETTATCAADCPPTGDDDATDDDVTDDDSTDDDIVEPCGDGTCDPAAGETTATCAGDCPTIGDDDATDDDVVDPCGDGTCETAIGETSETCPGDCPPTGDDDDDDTAADDDTADDDLAGDDDIVADPCAFAEARVRELTAGCAKDCEDPIVTLDGSCIVEMGETPNISQIALTDAIYSIDTEEGSAYLIGGGSVSITDSGYELDTVYGDFVVGVTGTKYDVNLDEANNKLTISVAEGSVDVFYKGNKVATLEALPEIPAVMEFDTNTGEIIEPPTEEIPGECTEAPQRNGHSFVRCVPDLPDPDPKGCGGCDTNTPATAGLWALMLAAIANTRRSFLRQKIS